MNKNILKGFVIITIIIVTMILLTTVSHASLLSISTSKSSASPGEVFIVTVTLNGGAGQISASTSNGSGSGAEWLDNSSFSFSCTAGSSGTVTISASGVAADYTTEADENLSASKSVTIEVPTPVTPPSSSGTTNGNGNSNSGSSNGSGNSKPATNPSTNIQKPTTNTNETTKSSNSNLASLAVTEGVLTPEFNASIKEYIISVPNEITKLNISAVPEDSKATVSITGNEELQLGENNIEITVTAEDGSKSVYKILATRNQEELGLQTLTLSYIDENGKKVVLELTPEFIANIYEYNVEKSIPNFVKTLEIEALANRENANIEITGNEELKSGKNEITIKVTLTNEEGLEEQKTYKVIVNKEEKKVVVPLTPIQKFTNWFAGISSSLKTWGAANFTKIIAGILAVATTAYVGLTVYFLYDYKNYKILLSKLAEYNKANLMERANGALGVENQNVGTMEQESEVETENSYKKESPIENAPKSNMAERWNEFLDIPQDEVNSKKSKGKRFK